jgi:predicted DNA-binding protein with PD1-like motif
MKSKVVEDADVVTYVVVCDQGDEAVDVLNQFARSEQLEAVQITGVGVRRSQSRCRSTARSTASEREATPSFW